MYIKYKKSKSQDLYALKKDPGLDKGVATHEPVPKLQADQFKRNI